jgi:type IX secretion system substrate protein/galactose oxidase-like protein/Kelch motif protein
MKLPGMKKIIGIFVFCFLFGECFSQAGEWVWIKGDSVPFQPGNFGVQGVSSPTNNPRGFYEACEWTDLNGNFWLFGGDGWYGDFWKYDPLINEWTWMKGSGLSHDPGNYGTQGISSPTNNPPGRCAGSATWTDNQGNLWMFGGLGFNGSTAFYNDLWKYNITTNEWVWMKGSQLTGQPGIYGTQGIPDPANNPTSRSECASTWIDAAGDLWFFGGGGFNDVWRYNIASNEWTWMKGSQLPSQPGVYGSLGVENTANTPSGRLSYSHWKDASGKFWIFGGTGDPSFSLNDLWRYNPVTNNWAWMGGSNAGNSPGYYGTKCTNNVNNMPRARFENRVVWTDQYNNFWLFGGWKNINDLQAWNDLWLYCKTLNQWICISGDSIASPIGNWGSIGISNSTNMPNGRAGSVGWADNNGHLYFFGGRGTTPTFFTFNDLWKYTIDTTCGVCPAPNSIPENNLTNKLLVFPNPANSSLTISFHSSEKQNIELRIYNTLGRQVYFLKEKIAGGKFEKEIDVKDFSAGVYFIRLVKEDGIAVKKFLKEQFAT